VKSFSNFVNGSVNLESLCRYVETVDIYILHCTALILAKVCAIQALFVLSAGSCPVSMKLLLASKLSL